MSSIHKLGIIGIRSYSPEEEVVIKFFKPLTLILGKNGSGKTTIIECLKMAVCGSFPPNSNAGKTFICDPKLVGRPEVKAKIEIAFTAINQRKILGVRTFQLTNTEKKSEFRQMENVLKAKNPNGEVFSVTQKCAEMGKQIPELLGVSPAVLDNVIFCHQEESLWPFSDTAKLKSIFDDLFDTTKYTNLLENLKKVQKDYKKMAKESMNKFELQKKDYENLMKTQKNALNDVTAINGLQKQLDETQKKIKALREKMKPVENRSELERSLNIIKFKMSELKRSKDQLQAEFEQNEMQVFENNSLEDLKRCKDELIANYRKKEGNLEVIEAKIDTGRKNKEALQRQLEQIQHSERDQSEINIKVKDYRERILQIITVDLVGNENDAKLNEKVLAKAQSQTDVLLKEVTAESQKIEDQEQGVEADLNSFRSSLSSKEGLSANSQMELRNNLQKIQRLTDEINRLNRAAQGGRKGCDDAMTAINEKIDDLKEDLASFNQSINQKTKELMEITGQVSSNAKNKELLSRYQDYTSHKKELVEVERDNESNEDELKMLSKNLADISNNRFIAEDDTNEIIEAVQSYGRELNREKAEVEAKKEKSNDTVKEITSFLNIKQDELDKKSRFIEEFIQKMTEKNLQGLLEGDGDFLTQYRSIKDKLKQAEKRDMAMNYTEEIMTKLMEKSQRSHKCAICTRKLEHAELEKLAVKCREVVSKSSSFTGNEQRSLEELKKQKTLFKGMKNEYEEYRKDEAIVTQLKRDIKVKEKERNIAAQQVSNLKSTLENMEHTQTIIADMLKVAEKLEKSKDEIKRIRVKINDLVRAYPELRTTNIANLSHQDERELGSSMRDIQAEIEVLRRKANDTDNQLTRMQQQKDEVEKRKSSQQKESFELESKAKELESLKVRNAELEEMTKKLQEEVSILQDRTEGLEEKRKTIRNLRKQLEDKRNTKLQKLIELTEEFKRLYDIWVRAHDKKKRNLESEAAKEKLNKEIQAANDDVETNVISLQKLKEGMRQKDKHLKLIDDNIQLMNHEKELEDLEGEKLTLDKLFTEVTENERYNRQIQVEIDKEAAKTYQSDGKCSVLKTTYESSVNELKANWNKTEKAYIENLFEANVNQSAVDDIGIYMENLEKSLMLFHKQKMGEINKIIADLWMKTYKGTDIRKIEIKSDTEPNSKNKSFNYRIVFYNSDNKELEMKGRCSMGQKVIASIVIRLGLAEAFCTNCGILALDEPTTNLDKEHIKKLAKELCNLIEERQQNENFQLIIITHDKEFLKEVREHADEYYKVFKDGSSFSKIDRERTSTL